MENNDFDFDDIRPLRNEEVQTTIEKIVSDPFFRKTVAPYLESVTWKNLIYRMRQCKTVNDFQEQISCPVLLKLFANTQTKISSSNWEFIKDEQSYLYISNHRDIVLDAAVLNILMFLNERETVEIAIGDNLLIIPWVSDLVRLNKSFIVKRDIPIKQLLEKSRHLSEYISDTVMRKNRSIWIAQREGRAKDSNDITQIGVIKMLAMYDKKNLLQSLINLNIVPLSLSYEYDPCDYLKAKEFQLKRDNPNFKKTFFDDVENMRTGIMGHKGHVHIQFGQPIKNKLEQIDKDMDKNSILSTVTGLIDKEIHRNYKFFTHNYIAYDLMSNSNTFSQKYSKVDKNDFEKYIRKQIDKIDIENKDEEFLRSKIIDMYGNTVKNYLAAQQE